MDSPSAAGSPNSNSEMALVVFIYSEKTPLNYTRGPPGESKQNSTYLMKRSLEKKQKSRNEDPQSDLDETHRFALDGDFKWFLFGG